MQERSFLVQVLLDIATGGGAKLEPLVVDKAGVFDAGLNKGYNPVTVPSGDTTVAAEKGTVANHAVIITPEARISAGWQDGKSVTGEGIGISASELVSGTYIVSRAGSADVTNYQNVSVKSGGTAASIEKTTVDEHTVRFTPKATVAQGWQDNAIFSGESVDVNADELVSGTYPVTASGEFDVSAYKKISVPSGVVAASATKGIVAGHTVTITPRATRTSGFISGGETDGQGLNVTASELVSGTLNVIQSGTQDVTNYENISVPSGDVELEAIKGTVSNNSVTVTPRATLTNGFIPNGTISATPVTVDVSELVSGILSITTNGTFSVEKYSSVEVNIESSLAYITNTTASASTALELRSYAFTPSADYKICIIAISSNSVGVNEIVWCYTINGTDWYAIASNGTIYPVTMKIGSESNYTFFRLSNSSAYFRSYAKYNILFLK